MLQVKRQYIVHSNHMWGLLYIMTPKINN